MGYLQVLAPVHGVTEDQNCVRAALEVSKRTNARTLALFPEVEPLASLAWVSENGGALSPEIVRQLETGLRECGERAAHAVEEARAAAGKGVAADALEFKRKRVAAIADAVTPACALSDLAVFWGVDSSREQSESLRAALIQARTPCLVVREHDFLSRRAAIAWDGGMQAGRALRAALPLLEAMGRVLIVQAPDSLPRSRQASAAPEELQALLARRGIEAEIRTVRGDAKEGGALLEAAAGWGSGLFVCGAYGHSRTQEFMFGGATRSFLGAQGGPSLLLAH